MSELFLAAFPSRPSSAPPASDLSPDAFLPPGPPGLPGHKMEVTTLGALSGDKGRILEGAWDSGQGA